jgi:hypothetical protein
MFCTCEQKFKIHCAQTERIKIDTDEKKKEKTNYKEIKKE